MPLQQWNLTETIRSLYNIILLDVMEPYLTTIRIGNGQLILTKSQFMGTVKLTLNGGEKGAVHYSNSCQMGLHDLQKVYVQISGVTHM